MTKVAWLSTLLLFQYYLHSAQAIHNNGIRIAKELVSTTIWCESDQRLFTCSWTLPIGESCQVGDGVSTCLVDEKVKYTGSGNNCSITIDELAERHNGTWQCNLNGGETSSVDVMVATDAKVEFENVFGTLAIVAKNEIALTCVAKHGRPAGEFKWRVGEASDPDAKILESNNDALIRLDNRGYINVMETLKFTPTIEDADKRLFCIYEQRDESGQLLYVEEDHITLSIFFLMEPAKEPIEKEVHLGEAVNLTIQFEAYPKPRNTDITWTVTTPRKIFEVTLDDIPIKKKRVTAFPLQTVGDSLYEAMLMVTDVREGDDEFEYFLEVSNRLQEKNEIFMTKQYPFKIVVIGSSEKGDEKNGKTRDDQGGLSVGAISGIVIGVLLFILILAGFLFFSWKNQKFCFKPRVKRGRGYGIDQDEAVETPLAELEPNERPIIKAPPRPAETPI